VEPLEGRQLFAATLPDGFSETLVIAGLSRPTDQAFLPDGSILVTQKTGELRVIKNGVLQSANALKLAVDTAGDRGLNAVEIDSNYATNRFIYVVYMTADPARPNQPPNNSIGRLSRFTMNAAGTSVASGSELILLNDIPNLTGFHMGGFLGFGADGMLYLGTGDGGATSDSINSGVQVYSQDLSRLDGKILRINARNPQNLIPSDNPYVNTPGARPEVWAIGLRNAFSGAFRPNSSDLYIADVSQDLYEEINRITKGANYGWNQVEGPSNNPAYTDPVYYYDHAAGRASPTGVMFYDANTFPGVYKGKMFFGDYSQNWIQILDVDTGVVTPFATNTPSVLRIDASPDGGFYYTSFEQGRIYKITYTGTANRAPAPETAASKTSGPVGLNVTFDGAGSTDPDEDPLSYLWDFGDGQTLAGITASHVYTAAGVYQAKLIVTDNRGLSTTSLPIAITVGNNAPVVTINAPVTYVAGDIVNFVGTAIDPEDGLLPAGNYEWEVGFFHKGHFSDFITSLPDVTAGSFTTLVAGDTVLDQFYRIKLRVTDLQGLTYETYTDVKPIIKTITLASNVPGLNVGLDLLNYAAGTGVPAVAGMTRTLTVPPTQSINGVNYTFLGWSDGGAISHNIAAPSEDATYTAIYRDTTGPEAMGLAVQYYGTANLNTPVFARIEPNINWAVNAAAPHPSVPADQYSARWTGSVMANTTQRYTFYTQADDGVRLWVNNQLLIDNWVDQGLTERSATFDMVAGQKYALKLEYYERVGGSTIKLLWSSATIAKQIIPTANLFAGVRTVSAAPTGLTANPAPNGRGIGLVWADNSNNESAFTVQRKGPIDTDFVDVGTTAANATAWGDNSTLPGSTYAYRVRGTNAAGDSIHSNVITVTTPGLPVAPSNLSATVASPTSVSLAWTDSASNETKFVIERQGPGESIFTFLAETAANVTTYTNTGLTSGQTYVYRVRAANAVGGSVNTAQASAKPDVAPVVIEIVMDNANNGTIGAVTVTGGWATSSSLPGYIGSNYIHDNKAQKGTKSVRYTPNLPQGGTYAVYAWWTAKSDRASNVPVDLVDVNGVVSTVLVNQKLNGGKWNLLGAVTFGAGGKGGSVLIRTGGTSGYVIADGMRFVRQDGPAPVAPQTPVGVAVSTTTASAATLTWNDVDSETSYLVERSTTGGTWNTTGTTSAGVTTFTETGLLPGVAYSYRVRATNSAGPSQPSTSVTATTQLYAGNLGNPAQKGSVTWNSETALTMLAGGTDIQGTKDQGYFTAKAITGDFDVRVRVESLTATDPWAKAGLMARVSTAENARNAFVYDTPTVARMQFRTAGGGSTTSAGTGSSALPDGWLRLVRTGNVISGYSSTDGISWTLVSSQAMTDLPATMYVGLAATSHKATALTTAAFADLAFDASTPPPLPQIPVAPTGVTVVGTTATTAALSWSDVANDSGYVVERQQAGSSMWTQVATPGTNVTTFTDLNLLAQTSYSYRVFAKNITGTSVPSATVVATTTAAVVTPWYAGNLGSPAITGSATWTGPDNVTMTAGGTDIIGKNDQGFFTGKEITGDFDVRVRIESMTATDVWTKAGLMARVSTADNARNAFILASPTQNRFSYRGTGGGTTTTTGTGTVSLPDTYVRLVRSGSVLTGYASDDGVTWTLVASQSISALPTTMYVGLAATSHNAAVATTVVFEDLAGF